MKILLVDDENLLSTQLKSVLESQRYIVETAEDGISALDRIFDMAFDLVILDIMLPGMDGLSILKEMRKNSITTPVLMLSAKSETEDRVKGLDSGADDYLVKPFSTDELLARIRALFRRNADGKNSLIGASNLVLDTRAREVHVNGLEVLLTAREFSILEFLLYNKNRVVSRFSLAEHVWGDDFDPFTMSNFMDVHIKNLRKKIKEKGGENIITTIRGTGYIIRDKNDEC